LVIRSLRDEAAAVLHHLRSVAEAKAAGFHREGNRGPSEQEPARGGVDRAQRRAILKDSEQS